MLKTTTTAFIFASILASASFAIAEEQPSTPESVFTWSVVPEEANGSTEVVTDPVIIKLAPSKQFPLGAGIRKRGSNQILVPYCVAVVESASRGCAHIQYFEIEIGQIPEAYQAIDYTVGSPLNSILEEGKPLTKTPVGPYFEGYNFSPSNMHRIFRDIFKTPKKANHFYELFLKTLGTYENWNLLLKTRKNQVTKSDYKQFYWSLTKILPPPKRDKPSDPYAIPSPTRDNPNAPYAMTQCGWFDGASKRISARGWHAYTVVQDIYYSSQFFGDSGAPSRAKCFNEVVFNLEKGFYAERVVNAKKARCACRNFNGLDVETKNEKPYGLGERGWHLSYALEILAAYDSKSTEFFSAKDYGNGGTSSEEACKRFLVERNFICP